MRMHRHAAWQRSIRNFAVDGDTIECRRRIPPAMPAVWDIVANPALTRKHLRRRPQGGAVFVRRGFVFTARPPNGICGMKFN
jgi:hypothetical protein